MARERIFGLRGMIILLSILPSLLAISSVTYLSIRSLNQELAGDYIEGSRTAINLIQNQLKSDEDITKNWVKGLPDRRPCMENRF
jgi:hypothetical protein